MQSCTIDKLCQRTSLQWHTNHTLPGIGSGLISCVSCLLLVIPPYCWLSSSAIGLTAPLIVKPLVACGVGHSHSMALVLGESALCQLDGRVPLPAVAQEFVNHGGQQYKVYVLADKVSSHKDTTPAGVPVLGHHLLQYL